MSSQAAENWHVTTFAGDGKIGCVDGPAQQAKFNYPTAIVVTSKGDTICTPSKTKTPRVLSFLLWIFPISY